MKTIPILYENDEILIVNKSAGLAVQGGEGIKNPLDKLLSEQMGYKIYPVHRLDRDTAGILITAKNSNSASKWTMTIATGLVKKEYAAICAGCPKQTKGVITLPVISRGQTKNAETFYNVVATVDATQPATATQPAAEEFFQTKLSLIRFELGTGRMHQIRIHAATSGFPLCGDDKYGDFKLNKKLRKYFGVRVLQLAAVRLSIPLDGKSQTFTIPFPPHMEQLCKQVGLPESFDFNAF